MKFLLKFLAAILILALMLTGAGYILLNYGKTADVEWTQKDLDTGMQKLGADVENMDQLNIENIARGSYDTNGSRTLDATFTSEEISAMVASANDKSGPVRDLKIDFGDDNNIELSFDLSPDIKEMIEDAEIFENLSVNTILLPLLDMTSGGMLSLTDDLIRYLTDVAENKPIYASGTLIKTDENNVSVEIETLRLGAVPLPRDSIDMVEEKTEYFVNTFITSENGFKIEELRIENGVLYYKGTIPAEIEGVALE